MAGFNSISDYCNAEIEGRYRVYSFRKTPSQATTAGIWFDLSMSPGNPTPQYYSNAPLESAVLKQSRNGGIFHGSNVNQKNIKTFIIMNNISTLQPFPLIMLDYLMYYSFIDMSIIGTQDFTNSLSLPRYTDGKGVKIMCITLAAGINGVQFYCTYTNQDGVSGRVTPTCTQNTAPSIGTILNSNLNAVSSGPFLCLQDGDTGVKSIESVTLLSDDIGLFAIALVKPIFSSQFIEYVAPVEDNFLLEKASLPKVENDAYLNMICCPSSSLSGLNIIGTLEYLIS